MPGTSALQELEIAIDLCFRERLITPTLALLYSGIDTMAWLGLPDKREDVTRNDFTRWADHYLLPDSGLACTSLDLYSSRCGIVHSMTAESSTIRRGDAKRIFFAWGNRGAEDLQRIADRIGHAGCAVHVDTLIKAFQTAVNRFMKASELDSDLGRRVSIRLGRVLTKLQIPGEWKLNLS